MLRSFQQQLEGDDASRYGTETGAWRRLTRKLDRHGLGGSDEREAGSTCLILCVNVGRFQPVNGDIWNSLTIDWEEFGRPAELLERTIIRELKWRFRCHKSYKNIQSGVQSLIDVGTTL